MSYPQPPAWASDILTVGVTGTNGKTSTTRWVEKALLCTDPYAVAIHTLGHSIAGKPVQARLDFDGFLGVMKRGWQRGTSLATIELSSLALAHGFVRGWPCKIGVFTNLSHDHLDVHGDPENYLASKAQLFVQLGSGGTAILNADDPASSLLREVIDPSVAVWSYGRTGDVAIRMLDYSWEGSRVELRGLWFRQPWLWQLRAVGPIYVYNAVAALMAAVAAGVPWELAAEAIAREPMPAGRLQLLGEGPRIVIDYAHTPAALSATIDLIRPLCTGRLLIVLGAGGERDVSKRLPLGRVASRCDACWITNDNPRGEEPAAIAAELAAGCEGAVVELDRRRAIAAAVAAAQPQDVVLVAGKGHERMQIEATGENFFDDAVEVQRCLEARRA
jgi:UDP-N-acetylmuramoyl-L-alanyl-D-glutamate--2,6-diaminopimelate ligase